MLTPHPRSGNCRRLRRLRPLLFFRQGVRGAEKESTNVTCYAMLVFITFHFASVASFILCGSIMRWLGALLFVVTHANGMSCLDESGKAVAWFAVFKFPNSYNYAYADPTHTLAVSSHTLEGTTGAVSKTTAQAYAAGHGSTTSTAAYNDQPGYSGSSKYGHTKGFMAFTAYGGFWMVRFL
jgi:hypothetical protein